MDYGVERPSETEARPLSRIVRAGILVAGWALFGFLWWLALGRISDRAIIVTMAILAFAVVANAIGALLILRGRHDRRVATVREALASDDRLGRELLVGPGARTAQIVVVELDPLTRQKHLLAVSPDA